VAWIEEILAEEILAEEILAAEILAAEILAEEILAEEILAEEIVGIHMGSEERRRQMELEPAPESVSWHVEPQ